jgi:hypothetical protein
MRLRHILRRLAHSPMFTVLTVATLALGIGANTAIFSVIEGVLLKPLPYPNSHELISVNHSAPGVNMMNAGAAPSSISPIGNKAARSRTSESGGTTPTPSPAWPSPKRFVRFM